MAHNLISQEASLRSSDFVKPGLTAFTTTFDAMGSLAISRTMYIWTSFVVEYVSVAEKFLGSFKASRRRPGILRMAKGVRYCANEARLSVFNLGI